MLALAGPGSSSACEQTTGEFTIHELVWDGDVLRRVKLDFVQYCVGSDAAARGTFEYSGPA